MSDARPTRLTCSTDNTRSTTVFSHLRLPRVDQCMESLRSCPKYLIVQGRPDQNHQFLERGSCLCTLALLPFPDCGPSVPQRDRELGLSHFGPVHLAMHASKTLPFFYSGATLASYAVSMGLSERALTEVLVVPRSLLTATVLEAFLIAVLNYLKSVPTWYNHGSSD